MNAACVSDGLAPLSKIKHHAYMNYFQLVFVFVSCSMVIAVTLDTVTSQVMDFTAQRINLLNLDFQKQK